MRLLLPITIMVQALSGAGIVLGFGLLYDRVEVRTAQYLSTGAVVVTLVVVGLVMGPQLIAQQKLAGTYDFMWSLPVPRSAASAAWLVLNAVIAIPGMVAALLAGALRFGVQYDITWRVFPAVGLTLLTGASIGYAMAHAVQKPEITMMMSQILIFVIFGFSPISFPAENLPRWLAEAHEYLPFAAMADVVRASLVDGLVGPTGRSYAVLAVWAGISLVITAVVLGRRA